MCAAHSARTTAHEATHRVLGEKSRMQPFFCPCVTSEQEQEAQKGMRQKEHAHDLAHPPAWPCLCRRAVAQTRAEVEQQRRAPRAACQTTAWWSRGIRPSYCCGHAPPGGWRSQRRLPAAAASAAWAAAASASLRVAQAMA